MLIAMRILPRLLLGLISIATLFFGSVVVGEESFPFAAIVLRDNTPVRSGPAEQYYPTDVLHRGQQVEIYRHDSGDWYAIRPPRGSFSWVPAGCLQVSEDNLAEVMVEGVAARVGSRLSEDCTAEQVHLRRGEYLQILGERKFVDPKSGAPETWLKVAPPSGEFRWIFGPDVSESLAQSNAVVSDVKLQQHQTPVTPPQASVGMISGAPQIGPADLSDDRLDLALSLIVTGPVAEWNFEAIKARAEKQLEQADTALVRGRARLVCDEIARFEQLQQNYLALTDKNPPAPNRVAIPLERPRENPLERIPDFDGVGRLTPVVSRKNGAPKYALTDVKGNVLMFVSPALGVDLQSHLGKIVGVSGSKGFMPRLKKNHVSVSQVERLAPTALLASLPGEQTSR